jgi:N-acetylneuraminic acid mutarotase
MSTVGAPTNNIAYAAGAFANGNVYIWGGNTPTYSGCGAGGGVNTGGIYNVATDSWTSMSTVNAPAGRSYFATASSATQLFVWGGTDDHCPWNWYVAASPLDTVFNTGGVYTFATDQWTPMSTVNAPSARVIPSGVWTGSKFVVWGGYPDPITSPCTPGGAMYDPTSDTWTTISTVGAPSLCRGALVWTGSRVIVRDGQLSDEKTYINKGYIFNPETNTWEGEMTTVNQPSVFGMSLGLAYGNSNPWNGSQLFVWGNSGNTSVNSAYLYSP